MEKLLDLRLRKNIAIEEALGGERREVGREKFAQGGLESHHKALRFYQKNTIPGLVYCLVSTINISEWMTKPDHGGIKSPKSRFQGEAGDAGKRKQSSRHSDNTPRYCWGHTGGGGCGVKVPLSSGVFPA